MRNEIPNPSTLPEPPQPNGYPVIGNALDFVGASDPIQFLNDACRDHGDLVKLEMFGNEVYITRSPEDAKRVFDTNNANYEKSSAQQEGFKRIMGEDIIISEGELWRHQRNVLLPVISRDRVASFSPDITDYTEEMLDSWTEGEVIDVNREMMGLTARVMCKVIFNWEADGYGETISENLRTVTTYLFKDSVGVTAPEWLPTPQNRRFKDALETLNAIADEIIATRRHADDDVDDLITRTLEMRDDSDRELTNDILRGKVMTMSFAAHETTAQGLTFTLYLLSQHPHIRQRLQEELDAELDGRSPTAEDLSELDFLEAVIKESFRVYSPGYSINREVINDDELSGYHIPAGSMVIVYQWGIHRNPRVWDRPHTFDPDRWLEDGQPADNEFAYIPFGAGPRRCAGQQFSLLESKLVLATILQECDLELVTEPPIDFDLAVTTRPKNGIDMIPHSR
ncbi:cytochrome P450 [Natrinema ejinorense]|uniref:Cytochrome P450 n=1 Tax=Natrinema ejinorense TaxID=373386 RepID=A0A2A5QRZ6_9EURY|nr:cytochrome P450 [Natrinema ejinorense]PCR89575.1 hypothetical protein CP557_02925 [Natrinema ejinorense]